MGGRRDGSAVRLYAASICVGIVFGVAARLVDHGAPRWVGSVGAVWFLVGFLVGRLTDNVRRGAIAGAVCLVTANASYYLWRLLVDEDIGRGFLLRAGLFWTVMSIGCGLIAGAVGAKSLRSPAMWGVTAGVFAGEALAVLILRDKETQVVIELTIAAGCFMAAIKGRTRDVVMATSVGVASVIVLGLSYRAALGH